MINATFFVQQFITWAIFYDVTSRQRWQTIGLHWKIYLLRYFSILNENLEHCTHPCFSKNRIDQDSGLSLFSIRGSDRISLRSWSFQFRLTAFVPHVFLRTLFATTCRPTPRTTTFSCDDLGRWKHKNREKERKTGRRASMVAEGVRGERPGGGGGSGQGLQGW